jgi:hypothetical protein
MGLSLVSHETLVEVKPLVAKDVVNKLGKATIELRKWTLSMGRATKALAKLRFYSRPNCPTIWDSRDSIYVGNHKPRTLSLGLQLVSNQIELCNCSIRSSKSNFL